MTPNETRIRLRNLPRATSGRPRRHAATVVALCSLISVALAGCWLGPRSPAQDAGPAGTGPAGTGPVVTIVAVTESADAGAPLRFTVHAQPAPADDLTVRLVLDADACTPPPVLPSTITILAGEQEATLSLQTTDVEVGSDGCSVTVTIADGDGYRVGDTATSASVMIAVSDDDDPDPPQVPVPPAVTIAADAATVVEGTDVSFTLTATPAPASNLTVNLSWTQSGSFLAGARPATVTIPISGTATVSASTDDDGTDEPNGSVTLTVDSGNGYTVGSPSSATVAVDDNDAAGTGTRQPQVTVTPVAATVTEGTDVSFTLTATPAPASNLTVNLSWTQSGSFLAGARPATVTIPTSGTATVSASTDDDGTDEPNGSVTLTVAGGGGYAVGSPSSANVTVNDNDLPLPAVTVTPVAATVTEGTDVSFTLTATPAPASNLTVNLTWSSVGSFITDTRPSTVTIPTSGTATVSVSTVDDSANESHGSETLNVASGNGYTVGTPGSATVTVNDNDLPEVTIAPVAATVTEGTDVSFTLTATPAPASDLTVNVAWGSGAGSFLSTDPRPSTVTIPTAGTLTVSVSTVDDSTDEPNGSLPLTVNSGNGYTVGTPSSASVTIEDNDAPPDVNAASAAQSIEWGSYTGTTTDGVKKRVSLRRLPESTSYPPVGTWAFTVDLPGDQTCAMEIDPSNNPGFTPPAGHTPVGAGEVMVIAENTHGHSQTNLGSWNKQSSTFQVTFDGSPSRHGGGDERIRFGSENGDEIILDVTVTCTSSHVVNAIIPATIEWGTYGSTSVDGVTKTVWMRKTPPADYPGDGWVFTVAVPAGQSCVMEIDPSRNPGFTPPSPQTAVAEGAVMVISEGTHGHEPSNLGSWNSQSSTFRATFDGIGTERIRFASENGYSIIVDASVTCS